jgi:glycosyltransferase XagB
VLAPRSAIRDRLRQANGNRLVREAVFGLARANPRASAARRVETRQAIAIAALLGLLIGGAAVAPQPTIALWTALLTGPFLGVVCLRLHALAHLLRHWRTPPPVVAGTSTPAHRLPVYTVMVPLYRESHMIPGLLAALGNLDYPATKLDIKLVLEQADADTLAAAAAADLPGNVEIIVVPDQHPRTKPKALNYALAFARGDFVTIFDAEDVPEPGQLRCALAAFETGPADLACVQASLCIHNGAASFLSGQFAIEYCVQFDALLPSLARLGLPLPLGGTSNHFRTEALKEVGAWDPFNVTEDADLGLRLARRGWRTSVIGATTWEEAPVGLADWLPQRTRWLKGWMQSLKTKKTLKLLNDFNGYKICSQSFVTQGAQICVPKCVPRCYARQP